MAESQLLSEEFQFYADYLVGYLDFVTTPQLNYWAVDFEENPQYSAEELALEVV